MKKDRKKIRLKRKLKASKKIVQIYPMMPRKYSVVERKKLREKEKRILESGPKKLVLRIEK